MRGRGLLLDRDGVINADTGYVASREHFRFMPGIFALLKAAKDKGYRLAILTNQSGVARGYYTAEAYEVLTRWMLAEIRRQGVEIDVTLACFEYKGGSVAAYSRDSYWRKPNPGMVLEAIRKLSLDPERSIFLGDKPSDMQAAEKSHIRTRLMLTQDAKFPEGITPVRSLEDVHAFL